MKTYELKKSTRKPLNDAMEDFFKIQNEEADYRTGRAENKAIIERLDRDDFEDLSKAARQRSESIQAIQEFDFKISFTERAKKAAKDKVKEEASSLQLQFDEAQLDAVRMRLKAGDAVVERPEFEAFREQLQALYGLIGPSDWDSFLKKVLPCKSTHYQSQVLSKQLFEWPPEPEKPFEILQAKYIAEGHPSTLPKVAK